MTEGFLLFPGQGTQVPGMAKSAYDAGGYALALFDEASEILGLDLADLTFNSDPETLARTENCQPALLVACLALLDALREYRQFRLTGAAGLSLGEYTALVALEALDFADAVRLVRRRGELMEAAGRATRGGMASVLGLEAASIEAICAAISASGAGLVTLANYNCPGQVVISGDLEALALAETELKAAGARRVLSLRVSGAFHSPFMEPARRELEKLLADVTVRSPSGLFVNNADAQVLIDPPAIAESLARQVTSPVRWEQSCRLLVGRGETEFYEIGPGRVCSGLMKRIAPEATVIGISDIADIDALPE
ncbi:MAG: ACP S-malonyltransferase [Planctomycetota bacterium]|jgi:[acyl-carrier-protein] S-malonyltransferase|nr:ACP S-malonyltransferase [Planctomycetota bacterium]